MILWGNISHFSVFMILQLLAGYQKSGLLELEHNGETAVVFLKDGYVQAVSLPKNDHLLGTRLVQEGCLSRSDLHKVMLSAGGREGQEFLGAAISNSGLAEENSLVRILKEQAYENTLELSDWVRGTFKFVVPVQPVVFSVAPQINVQHLLLEISRRLDEGQRPAKTKTNSQTAQLCASCTSGCTLDQRKKYLRGSVCLWRNMPSVVRESLFTPGLEKTAGEEEEEPVNDLPFL